MKIHVTAYPHWTLSNHQQTWNKILNFWMKATFLKLIHQLGSQILAVRRKYLHQNPRLHVKIVLHRSDLLFYLSHKPHVFPVRSAKLPLPPHGIAWPAWLGEENLCPPAQCCSPAHCPGELRVSHGPAAVLLVTQPGTDTVTLSPAATTQCLTVINSSAITLLVLGRWAFEN